MPQVRIARVVFVQPRIEFGRPFVQILRRGTFPFGLGDPSLSLPFGLGCPQLGVGPGPLGGGNLLGGGSLGRVGRAARCCDSAMCSCACTCRCSVWRVRIRGSTNSASSTSTTTMMTSTMMNVFISTSRRWTLARAAGSRQQAGAAISAMR